MYSKEKNMQYQSWSASKSRFCYVTRIDSRKKRNDRSPGRFQGNGRSLRRLFLVSNCWPGKTMLESAVL